MILQNWHVCRCPIFCPKWSEDQNKKIITFPDAQFFAQNEMKTKKKVITFADAQFWDMKILRGCCRIIGRGASLHGFAPMVMKRFEIIEKLYLSKALLKMAGGGDASPHTPPLDPPLVITAGQHNVPAQKVFLEENGCYTGRCCACDVIIC